MRDSSVNPFVVGLKAQQKIETNSPALAQLGACPNKYDNLKLQEIKHIKRFLN